MIDKLSGDQRKRIEYLEIEIKSHNQKNKDRQIILKSEIGILDGISDQFSQLNTALAGDHKNNRETLTSFQISNFDSKNSVT